MLNYTPYTSEAASQCVALWNRSLGGSFPMDLALWQQNVDQCPTLLSDGSWLVWEDSRLRGCVFAKTPRHVSALVVDPGIRRRGIGAELLRRSETALRESGADRFVTGQDDRHFFPGVPEEADGAQAFFAACGYARGEGIANDLKRSLIDYVYAGPNPETTARMQAEKIALRFCEARDLDSLFRHVEENYSARWLRDTKARVEIEPSPSEIQVAVRNDTDVVGFCHTFSTESRYLGPSISWRALLGTAYGGLGPIGVGKDVRKIGLGLALLDFSVNQVKCAGAETMAIDWTDLVDFYGRVGFTVWKRYRTYHKSSQPTRGR